MATGTPIPKKGEKPIVKLPAWVKAIPESVAHGSGTLQKRLWHLVSDYVRIRDWHKYKTCIATGKRIEHWQDGQAGHFISYSCCNGMFKFDERNIHMQSAKSNCWGGFSEGAYYEKELIFRHNINLADMNKYNLSFQNTKPTNKIVIEKMKYFLLGMMTLKEQPDYFNRAIKLLTQECG